jgi:GTP-binding protein Era
MEIMELLDRKVHLQLWVKVRENWVDDVSFLHILGLGAQE